MNPRSAWLSKPITRDHSAWPCHLLWWTTSWFFLGIQVHEESNTSLRPQLTQANNVCLRQLSEWERSFTDTQWHSHPLLPMMRESVLQPTETTLRNGAEITNLRACPTPLRRSRHRHDKSRSRDKELGKSVTKKATPKSGRRHKPESALRLWQHEEQAWIPGCTRRFPFQKARECWLRLGLCKANQSCLQGPVFLLDLAPSSLSHYSYCSSNPCILLVSHKELCLQLPGHSVLFPSSGLLVCFLLPFRSSLFCLIWEYLFILQDRFSMAPYLGSPLYSVIYNTPLIQMRII